MSFILLKKKRFKFKIDFDLEELSSVPFVNGVIFCKVRLLDGTFSKESSREPVQANCVRWRARFSFVCKMCANAVTGVLDPCLCRVSVRKVIITTQLMSGDPCFKTPKSTAMTLGIPQTNAACLLEDRNSRGQQISLIIRGSPVKSVSVPEGLLVYGHSRTPSHASQRSKNAGYTSNHSSLTELTPQSNPGDSASTGTACIIDLIEESFDKSVREKPALPVVAITSFKDHKCPSTPNKFPRQPLKQNSVENQLKRVDATRVNADDVIEKILQSQDFSHGLLDSSTEEEGLSLFVGPGGSTALGSQYTRVAVGTFEQVVIQP
ncbi:EEIG family member 2-like isoform X3 [Eucyclogobius newberryi]|uniref:EEIG family member 2-like isoform X3 n=1 Tax=Eucyclogobius newberryi TaxID=166745 RepID=UPI003B5A32FF